MKKKSPDNAAYSIAYYVEDIEYKEKSYTYVYKHHYNAECHSCSLGGDVAIIVIITFHSYSVLYVL